VATVPPPEVHVAVEATRHPDPARPVAPPGLDREGVDREAGQLHTGERVAAASFAVGVGTV
jgi:hypothetical protein